MQKAQHYREHANECRALAARTRVPEHRIMLNEMAETWDTLAIEREILLERRKRIAKIEASGFNDSAR